ncbi:LysM peptidoglycan-binding domain-containing protein [Paludifilum halophilum]|uniref:LysM domain-containing protein n=1 Tax=Paludifilum halophilum TaxID=1642702 RepID=A0A235B7J3_9BACL|nr:LysM peptidoglycan-binding domain-containing protein [Paludifilum halophilum]OYD08274.1 hypothetical protein CHM34_05325 [Paludifilum halophilum]
MTESNYNQLRFDILEKVRLHPQQSGIGTLLELDLYPDVEIEDQKTHLKIQGYLRLNGTYLAEEDSDFKSAEKKEETGKGGFQPEEKQEEIAYVIPVEITLPADRADMEHIASEIESFDYKVLSPFELQIEAVLTIDGLLQEKQPEESDPSYEVIDRRKSPTFSVPEVSQREEEKQAEEGSAEGILEPEENEYEYIHVARYDPENDDNEEGLADTQEYPINEPEEEEEELSEETQAVKETEKRVEEQAKKEPIADEGASPREEDTEEDNDEDGAEEDHDRAEEPKVPSPSDTVKLGLHPRIGRDRENLNLSDQFLRPPDSNEFGSQDFGEDEKREFGAEDLKPEETAGDRDDDKEESAPSGSEQDMEEAKETEEEEQESGSGTGLEWARWMLKDDKDEFVKMRMVIVHKEDSLDTIADRYNVAASKIMQMNRLESAALEEGQIVYLPAANE